MPNSDAAIAFAQQKCDLRNAASERRQTTPGTKDANAEYCRRLLISEVLAISIGVFGITDNAKTSILNDQLNEMGHHEFPFIDVEGRSLWWAKRRSLSGLKKLAELFCVTPFFVLAVWPFVQSSQRAGAQRERRESDNLPGWGASRFLDEGLDSNLA